jgi:hypothetical protein
MRRTLVLMLVMALAMGTLGAAEAAKKKKKKGPKPVATTMYMHGHTPLGEVDGLVWLTDDTFVMTMDGVEPDGSGSSMAWHAEAAVPWNTECTGLPVGFPTWVGNVNGQIVGDVTVKVFGMGNAETVTARLWADVTVFNCNDAYVPPLAEVEFESAAGEAEVVFPGINVTAGTHIMIEFVGPTPSLGRVEYDSADAATQVTFGCIPPAGAKSCLPPPAE